VAFAAANRKGTAAALSEASARPCGNLERLYYSGGHALHSDTLTGASRGAPPLYRITPSEVEQKLLVPVLVATGVATDTYSLHTSCLQRLLSRKRYPDFIHQASAVQLAFPSVASMRFA
jgi:hypothetical protein